MVKNKEVKEKKEVVKPSKVTVEKTQFPDIKKIMVDGPEGKEELWVTLDELNQLKNILKAEACSCKK